MIHTLNPPPTTSCRLPLKGGVLCGYLFNYKKGWANPTPTFSTDIHIIVGAGSARPLIINLP
jgi:hypothetical protein